MAEDIKETDQSKSGETDEELNALLDNALQDFNQQFTAPNTNNADFSSNVTADKPPTTDVNSEELINGLMDEDTVVKLMSQFEQTFQSLLNEGNEENIGELSEQFSNDFKKIAEDTMKEIKEETGSSESEFTAAIANTLKNLSENADLLQGSGDDITNVLGSLGLSGLTNETDLAQGDFSSLFHNIMQTFLSKDVLYPSLKELITKYPGWLEENKASISEGDFERYSKQLEIMNVVCAEMETVTDSDTEETKSKRFSTILELMQKMHEYGHPPKCLIGDSIDLPQWL